MSNYKQFEGGLKEEYLLKIDSHTDQNRSGFGIVKSFKYQLFHEGTLVMEETVPVNRFSGSMLEQFSRYLIFGKENQSVGSDKSEEVITEKVCQSILSAVRKGFEFSVEDPVSSYQRAGDKPSIHHRSGLFSRLRFWKKWPWNKS